MHYYKGLLKTWIKQEVKQLLSGCTCWKPTSNKIAAVILFKEFIREATAPSLFQFHAIFQRVNYFEPDKD